MLSGARSKPYQGLDKVLEGSSAAEVRPVEVAVFERPQQLPLHCLQVLYQSPYSLLLILQNSQASCTMDPPLQESERCERRH